MPEKRMLIVDAEVIKRIEENRGDMSYGEFINFLIQSQFQEKHQENHYATREEMQQLEQSLKDVLHSFLEFFLSYGLELGKPTASKGFAELDRKLQGLSSSTSHKS